MILVRSLLLMGLVWLSGCAATDVANRYYSEERYAPVPQDQVQILTRAPDTPYEIIAEFQSRREQPSDVQRKAAEIGADAVIITLFGGDHSLTAEWAQGDRDMEKTFSRIVGVAIKLYEEK